MNLGLCIANLLRRYPAVEVPGIGVFRKTHIPASYDGRQSALLPPASHIELTEVDADVFPIAVYVQAQQQVDGPTAARILDEAVSEIMESISRNGQALLDGMGYLLADGASFVFKPFELDGFGRKRVSAKLPAVLPGEEADKVVGDPLIEEVAIGAGDEEGSPRRSTTMRWFIAAALLVLLSAAGVWWYYRPVGFDRTAITEFFGKPAPPVAEAPLVGSEIDSIASDVDSIASDTVRAIALPTDSIPEDHTPEAKIVAEKPSVTYEIIVGSFATMAQARKFVADMKAKGYDLQAIDSKMPGNRKKISWGSFATEEEAYRELARVKKNFEPGAWIAKVAHD